ncbi:JAB domain-containing protein [Brevibacillus massiliensis]|uniref:JAB domain-containing protein n=1 Tax=Brevibacillus massiliensis TaxID=1118054 RepID=UPI00037F9893
MSKVSLYCPTLVEVSQLPTTNTKIQDVVEAVSLFRTYAEKFHKSHQDVILVMHLNRENQLLGMEVVPLHVYRRLRASEIFSGAILRNVSVITVCRYCSSHLSVPSKSDQRIALRLRKAGEILGIELRDFIIVTKNRYFSLM